MIDVILTGLGTFFLGTGVVWALVRVILGYSESRGALIDIPNPRSSHESPTPRGGGLSMVALFLGAIFCFQLTRALEFSKFMALFWGAALVAGIGIVDDFGHVAARWRLLIHLIAAAWSLAWIGGFPALSFGDSVADLGVLGYPIGMLFLVWLLNLFNFMDGIDGIAASEGLFICFSAVMFCGLGGALAPVPVEFWILIVLAAGCAGFLVWNWPPASIFMGDSGSGFLGFILGLMALITATRGLLSIWCWLILFGVFIADTGVTLIRRILNRQCWYEAHRSHAYQHASRRYGSHRAVTLGVIAIDLLWLLPLAFCAWIWPGFGFLFCALALIPLCIFAYRSNAGML